MDDGAPGRRWTVGRRWHRISADRAWNRPAPTARASRVGRPSAAFDHCVEPTVTSPSFTAHLWLASLCLAGSVGMAGPASAAGASAPAPVELPPLTEPASGETHPGKMIWADLVTPDLKQAEQFYAALFGWSFEPVTGDEHVAIARVEGRPVAGIVQRPTKAHAHQPAWLTFLAVRDVAAADRSALANGGKVL